MKPSRAGRALLSDCPARRSLVSSSWTNRLLQAKDHASTQVSTGHEKRAHTSPLQLRCSHGVTMLAVSLEDGVRAKHSPFPVVAGCEREVVAKGLAPIVSRAVRMWLVWACSASIPVHFLRTITLYTDPTQHLQHAWYFLDAGESGERRGSADDRKPSGSLSPPCLALSCSCVQPAWTTTYFPYHDESDVVNSQDVTFSITWSGRALVPIHGPVLPRPHEVVSGAGL